MILANPIIVGELCEEDIPSEGYIICKDTENNYITDWFSKYWLNCIIIKVKAYFG